MCKRLLCRQNHSLLLMHKHQDRNLFLHRSGNYIQYNLLPRDVCCKPIDSYGINIGNLTIGDTSRAGLPVMQGMANSSMLSPEGNESYTDNTITQTLSQWRSDGMVDVINGSIAIFRPYMGGSETMLRRV